MRDSGQWVPVHGMNMAECPGNAAEADAAGYFGVFIDVARIIVVNEIVPERLPKNKPRKHYKTRCKPQPVTQRRLVLGRATDWNGSVHGRR